MTSMNHGNTSRTASAAASSANPVSMMSRQAVPINNTTTGIAPKFVPTLSEDDAVSQARLLKALADPTISHHLRILRDAGLVDCRKKGLWAYYYVRRESLGRAREVIDGLA